MDWAPNNASRFPKKSVARPPKKPETTMKPRALVLAAALACALPDLSWANDYPKQSIRILVPYAAGGMTDVVARIVGQ